MNRTTRLACAVWILLASVARADFAGPSTMTRALSPNGELLVRATLVAKGTREAPLPSYDIAFYRFDAAKDAYSLDHRFQLKTVLGQFVFVSNAGDLLMVNLSDAGSMDLYTNDGASAGSWDLKDFLTAEEIEGCAQTGSTLQWFEEGRFYERQFGFRGPSDTIRAVSPPYTLMRERKDDVYFSGRIDADSGKLEMYSKDDVEVDPDDVAPHDKTEK